MPGRSINIYLVDGNARGLRTAEIGLSTIKAVAVPRVALTSSRQSTELARTGIYILSGPDADVAGTRKIYIGEGDNVFKRLRQHSKDDAKEFWEEAVAFVSKDENLTKAHVRYLEARLIDMAKSARRATVVNETAPSSARKLPASHEAEMDEFLAQVQLLLGVLGVDMLEPVATPGSSPSLQLPGAAATQVPTFAFAGDGFSGTLVVDEAAGLYIMKQGAIVRPNMAEGASASYKTLRTQLQAAGVIAVQNGVLVFTQDYAFTSATAASQVLSGRSVSGLKAWQMNGVTLAEWEEARLGQSSDGPK